MLRLTVALFALFGLQTVAPAQALSPGTVSGKTYSNTELGVSFDFPADWSAKPEADRGLLDVLFLPPASDHSSIEFLIVDSSLHPEPSLLRTSRKSNSAIEYSLESEMRVERIGDREYLRTDWTARSGLTTIHQRRLYADVDGWHVIVFLSARNAAVLNNLAATITRLRFQPQRPLAARRSRTIRAVEAAHLSIDAIPMRAYNCRGAGWCYGEPQNPQQRRAFIAVVIGLDGKIKAAKPVGGDEVCMGAATHEARNWEYKPTFIEGQPVEVETVVTVKCAIP